MSISIRESIRWLPDAASEPTSTIVLTSPEHRFVDIRILKGPNQQLSTQLDWAFAGVSSSEIRNGVRHSAWRHAVDSRSRTPEDVVDEGDIFPQSDDRTLETGRMVNPATGRLTDYEEVWSDIDPLQVRSDGGSQQQQQTGCVVLELKNDEQGQRGMLVCLGEYSQGVVRVGDQFAAERWLLEDGKWQRKFRVGDLNLPSPEVLCRGPLSLGRKVFSEDHSGSWSVVELKHEHSVATLSST